MTIEKKALAALKWTSVVRILGQTVSWVIMLMVLRLLAPEDYGLMAISTVIIVIVASVADLGMGAALIQAPTLGREELQRVAGVAISLNLAMGLLVALGAPLAAAAFGDDRLTLIIQVLALQFPLNALCTVPQALARRDMNFKWLAWIELASGLTSNVSTLGLAWLGAGVWALVLGNLAGGGLRAVLLLLGGKSVLPVFRLDGIRRHLRFGGVVTANGIAWQAISQSDVLIAGRLLTQEAVGTYAVAFQLATLPMKKIMGIVNQVAFPTVARLQGERQRLRERLLDAGRLLTFVSVPTAWGISAVAPEFVRLAFGERWSAVVFPLQVVSLVVPFRMLDSMLFHAVLGLGKLTANVQTTIVTGAVLIPAFLIGTQWGADGLAFAWLVGMPIIYVLCFPRMGDALGLALADVGAAVWAPVAAGGAMYATVMGTRIIFAATEDLFRLPILIAVGAATYLTLVSMLDRRVWRDVRRLASSLRD